MRAIYRGATGKRGRRTHNIVGGARARPHPRETWRTLSALHYGQLLLAATYGIAALSMPALRIDGAAALAGAYFLCVLVSLRSKLLYAQLMTLWTIAFLIITVAFTPKAVTNFAMMWRGRNQLSTDLWNSGARVRRMTAAVVASLVGLALNVVAIVNVVGDLGSAGGKNAKAAGRKRAGAPATADARRSRHAITHFLMRQRIEFEAQQAAGLRQRRGDGGGGGGGE